MRPDDDKNPDSAPSGKDPLEPEELAQPPEPPEPDRPSRAHNHPHEPGRGQMKEPPRLRETSVRRIDHRGEAVEPDLGGGAVAEQAATLGETLANERRRQGKTLADVEGATRVRARLIEALEHGDYDALPDDAYVKGYIQSYAAYLEIPAGPLVAQFGAETAGRSAKADEHPYIKTPVAIGGLTPARGRGSRDRRSRLPLPGNVWVWVAVLVVFVVAVIGIAQLVSQTNTQVPPLPPGAPKSTPATAVPSGVPTASAGAAGSALSSAGTTPAPATSAPSYPNPPAGDFAVQVRTKADRSTHLRIRVDGTIEFDGTMPGGSGKTAFGTDLVTLRIDTPASIASIRRNGIPVSIPPPDATGGVTLRIPKP